MQLSHHHSTRPHWADTAHALRVLHLVLTTVHAWVFSGALVDRYCVLSALLHLNFRELQTQRPFLLAALAKKFHAPLRSVLAFKGDQPTRLSCMLNEGRTLTLGSLRFKKSCYSLLQPCLKISLSPAKSPVFFATITP